MTFKRNMEPTLDIIEHAFKQYRVQRHYRVGTHRVDLYFPDLNLVVECVNNNSNTTDEDQRIEELQMVLDCDFVRYDPHSSNFNVGNVINEILKVYVIPDIQSNVTTKDGSLNKLVSKISTVNDLTSDHMKHIAAIFDSAYKKGV